jgi:ubiquinone biosynthesis monooxygenase Coq7
MSEQRAYTIIDKLITAFDQGIKVLMNNTAAASRENPAKEIPETNLSLLEKRHSVSLLRVDHAGEICAQALYQGQALGARESSIVDKLRQASKEENDHLKWCHERIIELKGRVSYLNPLWYGGAFSLGVLAGAIGDQWSLGFLAETEWQVVEHLNDHLQRLPIDDKKSQAILQTLRDDEQHHATSAEQIGAHALPYPIKLIMRVMSKVMTTTAYWV